MNMLPVVTQLWTAMSVGMTLIAAGIIAGLIHRWHTESSASDGDAGNGQKDNVGPPLASWRYVYDVEKADADREIAAVQQQAEELSEADRRTRR